jgi:hypothetical protein
MEFHDHLSQSIPNRGAGVEARQFGRVGFFNVTVPSSANPPNSLALLGFAWK